MNKCDDTGISRVFFNDKFKTCARTGARVVQNTRQESFKNRLKSAAHVREPSKHQELDGPITGAFSHVPLSYKFNKTGSKRQVESFLRRTQYEKANSFYNTTFGGLGKRKTLKMLQKSMTKERLFTSRSLKLTEKMY